MRSDASTLALLHFNNPSNPYEDEIGNKWVPSGNIKLGPSNAKFSKSSLQVTAGSFLRKEGGFTLGGQDFTIEGWAFVDNASQIWAGIFGFSTRGERGGINGCCIRLLINNSNKNLEMWTMWEGRYSSTPVKGTLFHFAVVYQHNQSKWTLYVNGKSEATCYRSLGVTYFEHCYLAKDVNAGACNMIGSIDEFRVSSVARYTSNFTPPGAEFYFQRIINFGRYQRPVQRINGVEINGLLSGTSTVVKLAVVNGALSSGWNNRGIRVVNGGKFHSQCVDVSGSSYCYATCSAPDLRANEEWTLSLWSYKTNTDTWDYLVNWGGENVSSLQNHDYDGDFVGMRLNYNHYGIRGSRQPRNQWVHFAVVNHSSVLTLYMNGVKQGSHSSTDLRMNNFMVGVDSRSHQTGLIDDLIIVKGRALWTSNFTPPTFALVR